MEGLRHHQDVMVVAEGSGVGGICDGVAGLQWSTVRQFCKASSCT